MLTRAQKKRKIEHSMGVVFDETIFNHQFLQFLTVNDLTNLSMTCKTMQQVVENSSVYDESSSRPRLLWEERHETMVGYHGYSTYQIQKFTFQFSDKEYEQKMVVEIGLLNRCWIEHNNTRVPSRAIQFPEKTKMRVAIIAPATQSQTRERLFAFNLRRKSFLGPECGRTYRDFMGADNPPLAEFTDLNKSSLRRAMRYVFICVKRIANWQQDDIVYPSVEYLMRSLPSWMYSYFPEEITIDEQTKYPDRDAANVLEFSYQPAPDYGTWLGIVPDEGLRGPLYYDELVEHPLSEITWYNSTSLNASDSSGGRDEES